VLGAALLLGIVNAFVRPVVVLLTLPLTVLTLGLFLLVVNAMMLGLVSWRVRGFPRWAASGARCSARSDGELFRLAGQRLHRRERALRGDRNTPGLMSIVVRSREH
jgi:hypothetical protein